MSLYDSTISFRKVVDACHAEGAKVSIQLPEWALKKCKERRCTDPGSYKYSIQTMEERYKGSYN